MQHEERARFAPVLAGLKDGGQITLRPLSPSDGEAMTEFYLSVPREDYRFYSPHPLTREEALKTVERHRDTDAFVCVVGVDAEGRIVGYAWYDWDGPDSAASVFGICIRREFQGSGTGQALIGRLFEIAREIGPERMSLTVQKANPRAVALYRKMGFAVVREQTRPAFEEFPADPEYYMERVAR